MYIFLPKKKIINIQKLCTDVRDSTSVTVRKLSELIGTLTASIQAVFPAPLHYRFLQMAKNQRLYQATEYSAVLSLNKDAINKLNW